MSKEVSQSSDLRRLLVADQDGLVAAAPDGSLPPKQAIDLQGQVGVEIPHEVRELSGILHGEEKVIVIAEEDGGMTEDRDLGLGSSQDSSDDLVQGRARSQEELGLVGPDSHLDDGAPFGHKA
ncbi:MAG: hypothetical protein ABUT39_12070 [Acidobacteriota bacterium]